MNSSDELKKIEKKIISVQIIASPGIILFGLGWYDIENGKSVDVLHPLFNNQNVVYSFLAIGAIV